MRKNVKLLSTLGLAALNTNETTKTVSTVDAASITLPSGYTKSAIIKWNQTGKAIN